MALSFSRKLKPEGSNRILYIKAGFETFFITCSGIGGHWTLRISELGVGL